MTEITTPAEGIYSDEGGEPNIQNPQPTKETGNPNPKLLHERNTAREEAEQAKAMLEETNKNIESIVTAKVQEALSKAQQAKATEEDKINFSRTFGEEETKKVDEFLKDHPTLTYEQAHRVVNPEAYSNRGQSFTPIGTQARTGDAPSLKTMSDEEIRAAAKQEAYAQV